MATISKTQLLNSVYTILHRRSKPEPRPECLTVLEAVVYGICHEGTTREQANQALSRFKDDFFDWNEVRVTSIGELADALADLPDPELRAGRIRKFLNELFEKTYGFTLESLTKKPLKDAIKILREYEAFGSDYVLATVIQESLAGHAIPIDAPTRRVLERLGVATPETDPASLRASLERAIPKNRGVEFVALLERLAQDPCVAEQPDCPVCDLRKICPTGLARVVELRQAAKTAAKSSKTEAKSEPKTPKIETKIEVKNPKPDARKPAPRPSAPRRADDQARPRQIAQKKDDEVEREGHGFTNSKMQDARCNQPLDLEST